MARRHFRFQSQGTRMKPLRFTAPAAYGIATAIAAAGLAFDLLMGRVGASGAPYTLLVLCGFWFPQKKAAYMLAGVATCLTLADAALSSSSRDLVASTVNWVLNLAIFWMIAAFIHHMREIEASLKAETQRANLLLHEVNHRVANKLQFVLSFLRSQSRHLRNEEARKALDAVASRVLAVTALQRHIATMMTEAPAVRIDTFISAIAGDLRKTLPDPNLFKITVQAEPVEFAGADTVAFGLIMNELITNAIKHGFPGRMKGSIAVRFASQPDGGAYVFEVEDDGVGMEPKAEASPDGEPGSPIVRELANLIGGSVVYEPARPDDTRRPGTRCRLVLPPAAAGLGETNTATPQS
jgi:two-component sensor histidine kinase